MISCKLTIFFNLARIKSFIRCCRNITLICFNSSVLLEGLKDFKAPTCFSVCFSKAFPKKEYANLACSISCLRLEGSISSPVTYSYLSFFRVDNANIFAASLLISYCNYLYLILSSIFMISYYILSKRFFLNREGLSDARVASDTKKNRFCSTFFVKIHKVFKVSI